MRTIHDITTARKPCSRAYASPGHKRDIGISDTTRPRAYASPVPREEVAQRIADSIRLHADQGITRQPEQYTCSPQTLALIAAIFASEEL